MNEGEREEDTPAQKEIFPRTMSQKDERDGLSTRVAPTMEKCLSIPVCESACGIKFVNLPYGSSCNRS